MVTEKQSARRERIEAAAYEVLKASGYKATSMLAVARHASVSNETLYNWYGNKQALFRSLIESNAREARELLERALQERSNPLETLAALGPILLSLVTGERAVVLNRAAVGDLGDTRTLAPAIAQLGRDTIAPLLCGVLEAANRSGLMACDDPPAAADLYFRLLIGDLQVRRIIGVLEELTPAQIEQRAREATALFIKLHHPGEQPLPPLQKEPFR